MESTEKKKWWQTLPAIITAVAGLIGSVTTLYIAVNKNNITTIKEQSISGKWYAPKFTSDTEGIIYLTDESEGIIKGHYHASDDGRIVRGHLSKKILTAFWIENVSTTKCFTTKDGSRYWGKIKIVFDEDFKKFDGWWSYCDKEPTNHFIGKKL
jgi:hypothetical protein